MQTNRVPTGTVIKSYMDYYNIPIGFGMALAMNPPALNAYSAMTEPQKQNILNQAHQARSKKEMQTLVAAIAANQAL